MTIPVTVIVAHKPSRSEFFESFCYPSLVANEPAEIRVMADPIGAAAARNKGMKDIQTPFLFHADDDVIYSKYCLDNMIHALRTNPSAAFAYCDFAWITMPGAPEHPQPPICVSRAVQWNSDLLKSVNYIDTSSLVRSKLMIPFDEDPKLARYHDWDLWLTMMEHGYWGVAIQRTLFYAFNLDGGLTSGQDHGTAYEMLCRKHGLGAWRPTA